MILDEQLQFSDEQTLTASGSSTNLINLGADRNIGIGKPMAAMIVLDTVPDAGNADETYAAKVQVDTVEAFSSPTDIVGEVTIPRGTAAGTRYAIPLPPDTTMQQFVRLFLTIAGTTPSITFTAALVAIEDLPNNVIYPDNITITG